MMNVDDNYDFNWDDPDVGSEPKVDQSEEQSTEVKDRIGEAPAEEFENFGEPDEEPEEPTNIDELEEEPPSEEPDVEEEYAEEPEESSEVDYNTFVNDFVEDQKRRGIFEEDDEITAENVNEKIVEAVDRETNRSLEQLVDKLSDVTSGLLEYEISGGDPNDFLQAYSQPESNFDIEDEQGQEDFMRWWLKERDGYSSDEVEDQIDFLLEKETLDKHAKSRYEKWQSEQEKQKEQLRKEAQRRKEQQEAREQEMKQQITESISNLDEAAGLDISDKEKREVIDFLTKPTYKTENGFRTGFAKEMSNIWNNPEALFLVAKLAKDNFKLSDLQRKAETEVTKKVEDKVRNRAKTKQPKSSRSPRETTRFLVDKMK